MRDFLKNNWPPLVLAVSAFLTRFLFLAHPSEQVFDEVYFQGFVKNYFNGQYYFDIHPPLGKLIIYFFARILGFDGQASGGADFFILRLPAAFFGALFVLLIYYLILKMGLSKKAAFLGAALVLLDNAILVQSKLTLIDIFLLFFGFLSLYFLFWFKNTPQGSGKAHLLLGASAVSACLSFSVKWTGLSFLAIVGLFFLMDAFRNFKPKRAAMNLLIIIVLPLSVYYGVLAVHFSLLANPGPGDAYMSPAFQQMIRGENGAPKLSLPEKFAELNEKMFFYNATITATHPYSSKWYQWPFDERPIWYWTKSAEQQDEPTIFNIYLVGNPAVWWPVLFCVAVLIVILPFRPLRKKLPWFFYILFLGYFINILPFILIGRVTFLYHYLSSLIFGILILAVLYDVFLKDKKNSPVFYWGFIGLVLLCFLLVCPLSYGFQMAVSANHYYESFIKFLL